ncbi:MAG TPA: DNA polymerase I [Candidatus Saccharimonadales bacterium]
MGERLVIIDGKSVFYRGYYAMPSLSTKDGTPTGGVYGFAVMALEVIKRLKPDYVCVAWDKRHTNIRLRRELYPAYKGNRKPAPPDFYEQIPLLYELLESLGWPLYELDDYEADDIMGAFAEQAGKKGIESFLVTSDLDVLQLVNEHTHIYTLKHGLSNIELFNVAHFEEKYGVGAHQWVDVKALKGDASDNIPGVAGVGEKTALDLIEKYKTLDGVYENIELLKPALQTKLKAGRDMAYLSKKLVTLMVDAPISLDFDKAKLHDGVRPEFVACLRKLEFRNLLRQAEAELAKETSGNQSAMALEAETIAEAKTVSFESLKFEADKPRMVALNPEANELWVSVEHKNVAVLPIEQVAKSQHLVTELANGPLLGHDLKSVYRALLAAGVEWPGETGHDTRIAAFILNSLIRSHELGDLLNVEVDVTGPGQVTTAIWQLFAEQTKEFDKLPHLKKLAERFDFPMVYLLAKIEHRGILLDSKQLNAMSDEFAGKIKALEQKIYGHAGQEFNIGSPVQLGMILFEKLGLPTDGVKKGKTGYSTGAVELAKLRALHPIIDLITEYREYTKLKSTYVDTLPKQVDAHGRLHTTFTLDVAATGRLSSINPNLQNIPTRTEMGVAIRHAFVPKKGYAFVSADYSQFELRLAAVMADDKKLIADFNNQVDIHTKTAAEIYDVPIEKVDKNMRRHAKVVNFGILYGMSPHGLAIATGMTFVEAKKFIDKYFELRAPIREYIDNTVKKALDDGYVETIFGRRRPTPDLKSSNFAVREAAKRAAMNMPIQGTEADLMKLAMLKVEKVLANQSKSGDNVATPGKAEPLGEQILQVHDSILVECPEENVAQVAKLLKETMESIHPLPVHLIADITTGHNWGEL